MEGLFGAAAGSRLFDLDQLKFREDARQQQELAANTEYKKAMAAAALGNASAEQARVARQAQLAQIAAKSAGDKPPQSVADQIAQLIRVSQAMLGVGEVGEATKLLESVGQITQRFEAASASKSAAAQRDFQRAQLVTGELQRALTGVKSQADLDAAKLAWQSNYPDEPWPPGLERFDPAAIEAVVRNSKAWLDAEKLRIDRFNAQSADDLRNVREQALRGNLELNRERTNAYVASSAARGKADGEVDKNPVGSAPLSQVGIALNALKTAGVRPADDEEAALAARMVADDAWTIHRRNPAKSYQAALAEAIETARERGELSGQNYLFGAYKTQKFTPKTGGASRPLPEPADESELVPGNYYQRPDGTIVLVKKGKNGLEVSVTARPARVPTAPLRPPAADNPLMDNER